MGFFDHVTSRYSKYPIIDQLKPIHEGYEVDGVNIHLPDVGKDCKLMPIRAIMERNCEARIRTLQVKKDKEGYRMWVTLWEEFSVLNTDLYRCFNVWTRNLRDALKSSKVLIYKIDFKVDSKGALCTSTFESVNNKLVRALNRACERLTELDSRYLDNQEQWVYNVQTEDQEFYALKGFRRCQTFLSGSIIADRNVHYDWKRYHKQSELM